MPITALYASLLAVLLLILTFRTIFRRRAARVEIGTAGAGGTDDRELLRRVRVHANFVEYVPFALVQIAPLESLKAPAGLLHALGATLLAGRVIHAYGLSQTPHIMGLRVAGMVLTTGVIAIAAVTCAVLVMARPG